MLMLKVIQQREFDQLIQKFGRERKGVGEVSVTKGKVSKLYSGIRSGNLSYKSNKLLISDRDITPSGVVHILRQGNCNSWRIIENLKNV